MEEAGAGLGGHVQSGRLAGKERDSTTRRAPVLIKDPREHMSGLDVYRPDYKSQLQRCERPCFQ
jgi:hypothetical protein